MACIFGGSSPLWGLLVAKQAGGKFDYVDFQSRSEEYEHHQAQVVGQVCHTKRNPIN